MTIAVDLGRKATKNKNNAFGQAQYILETSNKGANSEKNEIIPGVDHSIVVSLVFEMGSLFNIFSFQNARKKNPEYHQCQTVWI